MPAGSEPQGLADTIATLELFADADISVPDSSTAIELRKFYETTEPNCRR